MGDLDLDLQTGIPDRRDRIDVMMEEGDHVWMRYSTSGTHKAAFCGVPPTGKRVGVPVVSLMKFVGGEWKETWKPCRRAGNDAAAWSAQSAAFPKGDDRW